MKTFKYTIESVNNVEPDMLRQLFNVVENIGVDHDYSAGNELTVYAGNVGIIFTTKGK